MRNKRNYHRLKRHRRIRLRISGTALRPRLVVHRSLKNLSAAVIDDTNDIIVFSMSTQNKEIKNKFTYGGNIKAAEFLAEEFAKKAKEKGISQVAFDRGGYLYHGRIKAFAEALRKGGMIF